MAVQDEVVARRRGVSPVIVVLAAVVVLAALFLLVIRPLFFNGDEVTDLPEARPVPTVPPEAPPTPAPEAPPETFEVFESKDPFRPLVVAGAPAGSTVTAGTAGAGTTGGTTTGGTTTGGTTTGGTTGGTGAGGAPAPSGGSGQGQRVALLDIMEKDGQTQAQIKVGSTVHTVSVGEVFAGNFKLVSVSGNCATLLHGDDKFTVCEGEEVIK